MSKILNLSRLDLDHNAPSSAKKWKHWRQTFVNFLAEVGEAAPDKLRSIINIFEYVEDCPWYKDAMETLEKLYVKTPNKVFARHRSLNRRQNPDESLDNFLQELKVLSKHCNYTNVTAQQYREEQIRDAFISGISSNYIRQRLLESPVLALQVAFDQGTQRSIYLIKIMCPLMLLLSLLILKVRNWAMKMLLLLLLTLLSLSIVASVALPAMLHVIPVEKRALRKGLPL